MKILIATDDGNCLGFADRLSREGHDISVYFRKGKPRGTGIFTIVDNIHKEIRECNFCISDIEGWELLDKAAKTANRPVIGSHSLSMIPNRDAIKQYTLFQRYNLPIPETEILNDVGEAINAALTWGAGRTLIRYGESEFRCDYRDWLSWAILRVPVDQKILFQRIVLGHDAILTGWFDGFRWLDSFSISPDLDTNLYRYAAVMPLRPDHSIVEKTLKRLTAYFLKLSYRGPVHLRLTIKGLDVWVQSMQVGFSFPLDYTILEFFREDLGRFFNTVAFSNDSGVVKTKDFVGVVQAQCLGVDMIGAPILHLNEERQKHLVLQNVSLTGPDYSIAADNDVIFTATAHGPTVEELCNRIYETVDGVKFPEKHFNRGLGSHVSPFFEQIKTWRHL